MNKFACIILIALLGSACGGESKVGNQEDAPPIAIASVFGANANTSERVSVRSGSDILLSGQNSDGIDDPILEFQWKQVDDSGHDVVLFERTSNSVIFTAPQVPADANGSLELAFELQIQDGDGAIATDTIIVDVVAASDINHFLSRARVNETYAIFVTPVEDSTLDAEVPITVTIDQHVKWTDRQGVAREQALSSHALTGLVPVGSSNTVTETINEYFIENIPLLDADEVNQYFQAENRDARLEQEHIDNAELQLTIRLSQHALGPLTMHLARKGELGFELLDGDSVRSDTNTFVFDTEWLRSEVGVESAISAENYYKCIDPLDEALTLNDWLIQAGFNQEDADVKHTTYLNNFDLNFGRDMYLRTDINGNIYTYVTNYPTLENALSGRNDFAVVVMEFSAAPTGTCGDGTFAESDGKKIVKFYAYVPDDTTGEYVRAPTMNFDGRGERALPGVCIACHYGDTNVDEFNVADYRTINANAADLDSSFMVWDLDSFLYTVDSTSGLIDPVYSANEISTEVTERFSRDTQEYIFHDLNQAVLHTFTYDEKQLKRFETPIKLLHGFYGNKNQVEGLNFGTEADPLSTDELLALKDIVKTLPPETFDGSYVQAGWEGQEELYHKVYARNCRLCHAQIGEQAIDFNSYEELITNERLVPYVFERGLMPLSRLTMDRFWTDFYSEQSSAEFLRDHLNSDNNPNNDVAAHLIPGFPVAIVTPEENSETFADIIIDYDEPVLLDGTGSLFTDAYQWRVNGVFTSTDDKILFEASQPGDQYEVSFLAIQSDGFTTSELLTRTIQVQDNHPTVDSFPDQSVVEGNNIDIDIFSTLCPTGTPDSTSCRAIFGDIRAGQSPTIQLSNTPTNGQINSIDSVTGVVRFTSTASEAEGNAGFEFTLTDSFSETSDAIGVNITVNSLSGPQIGSPDTCTTAARSFATASDFPHLFNSDICADPSLNDSVADGLSIALVSVDGTSLRQGASVAINSGVIEYSPARFFTGQDSFNYTVQDNSPSAKTSSGTVIVSVNATTTFTSLSTGVGVFATSGDTGCASCHTGNLDGAPNWLNSNNVLLAATNDAAQPYGTAEFTLAEPTTTAALLNSILFKQACNFDSTHPGGNRLCIDAGAPSSVDELNAFGLSILRWLEEGGLDN